MASTTPDEGVHQRPVRPFAPSDGESWSRAAVTAVASREAKSLALLGRWHPRPDFLLEVIEMMGEFFRPRVDAARAGFGSARLGWAIGVSCARSNGRYDTANSTGRPVQQIPLTTSQHPARSAQSSRDVSAVGRSSLTTRVFTSGRLPAASASIVNADLP